MSRKNNWVYLLCWLESFQNRLHTMSMKTWKRAIKSVGLSSSWKKNIEMVNFKEWKKNETKKGRILANEWMRERETSTHRQLLTIRIWERPIDVSIVAHRHTHNGCLSNLISMYVCLEAHKKRRTQLHLQTKDYGQLASCQWNLKLTCAVDSLFSQWFLKFRINIDVCNVNESWTNNSDRSVKFGFLRNAIDPSNHKTDLILQWTLNFLLSFFFW